MADPRGLLVKEQDAARRPLWKRALPVIAAVLLTAVVTGVAVWNLRPPAPPDIVAKFPIFLAAGQQFTSVATKSVAISPDGTHIIYASNAQLFLRPLSEPEARPIPGSLNEGGAPRMPVFSPDGRSVAFFSQTEGALRRMPTTGGAALPICQLDTVPFGMSWNNDGILFAAPNKEILRVAENGGTPVVLVEVKPPEVAFAPQVARRRRRVVHTGKRD